LDCAARLLGVSARDLPRRLRYRETWIVAFREGAGRAASTSEAVGFRTVASPPGVFLADPFVIEANGGHTMLFELYDRRRRRGSIGAASIEGRDISAPRAVLERDYHLSYPFLLRQSGRIYMVPESGAVRQVQLFAALEFPDRWQVEAVLLDGVEAYDPTLFDDGSRFWLFVTIPRAGVFPHEELHLFSSRGLRGPYEPHPLNPVVSDIRTARPAGALFRREGTLFRPAQDCLLRYGHAIQIMEVVTLTASDYEERPAGRIEPHWLKRALATHTINCDGQYEVIDAAIPESRFRLRWRS
jgi:hypothetical protein